MGETADAFVLSEQIPVVVVEGGRLLIKATPRVSAGSLPAVPRRGTRDRWCSSLGDEDLACLLKVIECRLIPRLLGDYSPAKCSSLLTARDMT